MKTGATKLFFSGDDANRHLFMNSSGVYLIVSLLSKKSYVGSSKSIGQRLCVHFRGVGGTGIANAVKKHGKFSFGWKILEFCDPIHLPKIEALWMEKIKPEYNCSKLTFSAGGNHSEETIAKMKLFHALHPRKHSEETKTKLSNKVVSNATKILIGSYHKGKKISDSHKAAISFANKGRPLSEETKKKMSMAQKGKFVSEETRRKMSESKKGRLISDKTRAKMSSSQKGRIVSNKTKKKISETLKRIFREKKLCQS